MKIRGTTMDKRIGKRIKRAREAADRSQTWLGNKLSVSFQQVQKYENGSNRISAAQLWRISKLLKVDLESFFR